MVLYLIISLAVPVPMLRTLINKAKLDNYNILHVLVESMCTVEDCVQFCHASLISDYVKNLTTSLY